MPTARSGASVARTGSTVLPWLVRLRWAAVAAIAVTAAGVTFADVVLPLVPLGLLLAGLCGTNLLLAVQLRSPEPSPAGIGGVLVADALLLTGILHFAGGPMNPFSTIYLIGVTLAA
ncbi:MAG: sensor histidine kinase, partial [Alphaproteobacteria bacterium]